MSRTVKASELTDDRQHGPLFIDDDSTQEGIDGETARFARKVKIVHDHFGGERESITVEFADGSPERAFTQDEDVVVYNIIPGTDLQAD